MLTLRPGQPVQWERLKPNQSSLEYHQGVIATVVDNQFCPPEQNLLTQVSFYANKLNIFVLVKHDFSGLLELIETSYLSDYPTRSKDE